jgi:hypothetical protein
VVLVKSARNTRASLPRCALLVTILGAWIPLETTDANPVGISTTDALSSDAHSCFEAGAPDWSKAELFAWGRLCLGLDIDMNDSPGVQPFQSVDSLALDSGRYLSDRFFNVIFHRPRYRAKFSLGRIHISHAHLQAFRTGNISVNEIIIDNSLIDQDISIAGGEVKYSVQITDTHGHGGLHIFTIAGGQLDIGDDTFDHLSVASSSFNSVNISNVHLRKLNFLDSSVPNQLDIEGCTCNHLDISHVNGARISIQANQLNWLALNNVYFTNSFDIAVDQWTVHGIADETDKPQDMAPEAIFNRVSVPKWKIDFTTYPNNISVVEADVVSVNLGDHPLDFLRQLDTGSSGYAPVFYAAAIKFYGDTGRSGVGRDIQIRQKDDERDRAAGFDRLVLDINWAVIGYGFVIERGFLWIGLFVIIGYFVFKTGASQVPRAHVPDSWFYFTIDAVIPLISLNKRHEDVLFKGWRQHYLYFMKVLGAALAFLVIGFLKQSFIDTG